MKYLGVSTALLFFIGAVAVVSTPAAAQSNGQRIYRGAGCSSNPYDPSFRLGCREGASAQSKKTIGPKTRAKKPSTQQ
jgi:ABC-type sugar transport system substrate-binding protein